jgi:hypothetical protein
MRIKKFTSGLVSAQYSGMAAKKRLAWVRGAIGATFSNVIFDSVAIFKRPLAQRHREATQSNRELHFLRQLTARS